MKEKINKVLAYICILVLIIPLFVVTKKAENVSAASSFKYYDYTNKKTIKYEGTSPSYIIDSKTINMQNVPAIINDRGVAMASSKKIFKDSLGFKHYYNKSKKRITIKKNDTTLVMYLGSDKAYINGEEVVMNAIPVRVKYRKSKTICNLVPTRFVSEAFGLDYNWDEKTSTVTMRTPLRLFYNDKETNYQGTIGSAMYEGKDINLKNTPSIVISDNAMVHAKKIFKNALGIKYSFDKASGKIKFGVGDIILEMNVDSNVAYLNGLIRVCPVAPTLITMLDTGVESLYVPGRFVAETLGYKYYWNYATNTSEISYTDNVGVPPINEELISESAIFIPNEIKEQIYFNWEYDSFYKEEIENAKKLLESTQTGSEQVDENNQLTNDEAVTSQPENNYITNIEAGHNINGEYVKIVGVNAPVAIYDDSNGVIVFTFENTINALFDKKYSDTDSLGLSSINLYNIDYSTTELAIDIPVDFPNYYTVTSDNEYIIYFANSYDFKYYDESNVLPIEIPIPNNLDLSDIDITENYYDSQIILRMNGDYRDFYKNHQILNTNQKVERIVASYFTNDVTQIIIQTSKVQAFTTKFENAKLIFDLQTPRDIYSKIVILDPGHGANDPGTVHYGYNEKDMNFAITNVWAKELFEDSDIKVYYTRSDDTLIPLEDRAQLAGKIGADLFVSVHHNSAYNTAANGTSIYYYSGNEGTLNGLNSEMMAKKFLKNLTSALGTNDRGVIDKGFVVVRNTVPAVLLEIGFMSNKDECNRIVKKSFQKKVAKTIKKTIEEIFEEYPTGR